MTARRGTVFTAETALMNETGGPGSPLPAAVDGNASTRPVVLAIHGVGNPIPGDLVKAVRTNLQGGHVSVESFGFDWNRPGDYPVARHSLEYWAIDVIGRGFVQAANFGFASSGPYEGFGTFSRAVHNALYAVAHFSIAMGFGLLLVIPALLGLSLLPTYWFASYQVSRLWFVGWALLATFVVGLMCAAAILLLGFVVSLVQHRFSPFVVSLRRVAFLLTRPLALSALPPFLAPWETWRGLTFRVIQAGYLFSSAVWLGLYVAGFHLGVFTYAVVINAAVMTAVVVIWLMSWATVRIVGPGLKILLDIFRYVGDAAHRKRLQDELGRMVLGLSVAGQRPRAIAVVAHSLGAVIALDSLVSSAAWQPSDEVVLITMGSPLKRFFFRFFPWFCFPPDADSSGDMVANRLKSFRWVNIFRPHDPVGACLGVSRRGGVEINSKQPYRLLAAHTDYFQDPLIRDLVLESLGKTPPWAPSNSEVPAGQLISQPGKLSLGKAEFSYFAIAGSLLVLCAAGFLLGSGVSKHLWDAELDTQIALLKTRGIATEANVTYWLDPHTEYRYITKTDPNGGTRTETVAEVRYVDHLKLEFSRDGGRSRDSVDVEGTAYYNLDQGFFNAAKLRDRIRAAGEELNKPAFSRFVTGSRKRLHGVRLLFALEKPAERSLPWFYLPDFPPEGRAWIHAGDWLIIVTKTAGVALAGAAVLAVGFWWFRYFHGT
jgi:hypothetical protein